MIIFMNNTTFTLTLQPDILPVITVVSSEDSTTVRDVLVISITLHIIHYNGHLIFIKPTPVKFIIYFVAFSRLNV